VQRNWNQALVSSLLQNFCISQSSRSQKEFTKLLILNSLRIGLEFANKALLHPTKTIQLEHRIRRYQGIHQEVLNSRKEASSNYETVTDVAQDLSDAVEFVILSITNSITAQDDLQPSKKRISTGLQELFEDTRGLCAQQIRFAARIEAYTDRRYKVYESSLNQKDSDSVKRLTILATVFFPSRLHRVCSLCKRALPSWTFCCTTSSAWVCC
jgi:Mg2+ and Co2+ transporter CorA